MDPSALSAEKKYEPYCLESGFDRTALNTPKGRRKAHLFAAFVPPGCETVLDVGGGTGWATAILGEGRKVVTLDNTLASLSHSPNTKILASAGAIPFKDGTFDLVLSSQLLEHLPDKTLARATAEIERVAKKYILISVPYREALETRFVECGGCGHLFHEHHHCQSFSEHELGRLFPGWVMAEWHVFGELRWAVGVRPMVPGVRQRKLRKMITQPAPSTTLCPRCGERGSDGIGECGYSRVESGAGRLLLENIKHRFAKTFPALNRPDYPTFLPQNVAPYWIAALFQRENGATLDADIPH